MTAHPNLADLEALLDFYVASGVDCALVDEPVDRFVESAKAAARAKTRAQARPALTPRANMAPPPQGGATSPAQGRAQAPRQSAHAAPYPGSGSGATIPGDEAVMAAREKASQAATLDELRQNLAGFEGCNLRLTAKNLVFSGGSPASRLMFVGEAPGRKEDAQGVPFVGRSGKLLDLMLTAVGLDREQVYIANVVPWRPPGNRTPTPQEAEICKPFIRRQIELVDPDVLVFLGGASAKLLVGVSDGVLRLRGKWLNYDTGTRQIKAIATLHPAYLLRTPIQKRLAWRDFLKIKAALDGRE
ncbi:uracil-DNA glycosylase [Breoghania sp.]|uniref:uracil-DNA glycosylase n=1 Tax=Breoghania sp. TaxID=2065378 RepID=UPI002624D950|nr:uracil-DNA glycosylase [Breoghania sp.]MDJ0930307.1 uracil-DNA glycosylase [Breoghania sp.]